MKTTIALIRPHVPRSAPCRADSVSASALPVARTAFTLIEVVTVLVIIGAVATIGGLRYSYALSRYRADSAAQRITADIELARTRARTTSSPRRLVILATPDSYQIENEPSPINPAQPYIISLREPPLNASIGAVTINDGSRAFTFDGFGNLKSGGQLVITAGGHRRVLTVSAPSGRVDVTRQ